MKNIIPGELKNILKSAKSVVVLTGAGISAESGVPTFRGKDGLWKTYRVEELATPEAFNRNPKLVWEWYDWRRQLIAPLSPNEGHKAVAEMEKKIENFFLVTQNVDGLHRKAGSKKMLEIHGNIWNVRCTKEDVVSECLDVPLKEIPPKCACGALLRPHIVWFGESLDAEILRQAVSAAENCDLFFSVGTSALVQPAASFAMMAKENGACIVEVNYDLTPISHSVDFSLRGKSGEIMPEILRVL